MAAIFDKKGNYEQALNFYRTGNQFAIGALDIFNGYNGLASVFQKTGSEDSAIYYAKKVIVEGSKRYFLSSVLEASMLLTNLYKSIQNTDSAFKYQEVLLATKDSLFSQEKVKLIQDLSFNEQIRQQEIQQEQEQFISQLKIYALIVAVIVFLLITFILYRSNRHKQKAYTVLQKQKQVIDIQKAKVDETLINLKSTQSQLIQSEKMASLGELTAGIAHEIQNPLNFVNNFSSINAELIDEMKVEIEKGNTAEAKVLADDIKANEQKIIHHGQRAESIVKNMLQHSSKSSGVKEPTDINALADEYMRLSYHGLRAKDKTFNAVPIAIGIKMDLDSTLPLINVIPQDIGRVFLNLFNNAFWAVGERNKNFNNKSENTDSHGGEELELGSPLGVRGTTANILPFLPLTPKGEQDLVYQPVVSLTTKNLNDKIEIRILDNGPGIPANIKDKIFQPFFTTKPTGQGTGLGLSLAYDIIKAHNGTIKVNSEENKFTEFIIELPV